MRFHFCSLQSWCVWVAIWVTSAAHFCGCATAQSASPTRAKVAGRLSVTSSVPSSNALPAGVSAVLADLASRASVIFTGEVLAVSPSAGAVDVRFHVENPIRNCPQNGDYILREWAGLWTANPNRYYVGQHLLMFLTARGPSGISAPVDTNDGILPLVATSPEPLADSSGKAPADGPSAGLTVDLRWLQTRVIRNSAASVLLNSLNAGASADAAWSGPVTPILALPVTSLTSVLALIGTGAAGNVKR